MIDKCPICNTKLIKKDANYYCPNEECDSRKIEGLIHYASRDAMYIDGFGERIIEDLYNEGYLRKIEDFYNLYKYKDELMLMEGYGEKSINNLLESINRSKNNSLERLIYGLGIRYVGKKTAKILASYFEEMSKFINASFDILSKIPNIGDKIAESIVNYFSNKDNIKLINNLKELNINMKYLGEKVNNSNEKVNNKTFVITGTLSNSRDVYKEKLESLGANVTSSVTKKTDYVLVGENPGSKYDKAKELGITIINEDEYNNLIK